MPTAPVLILLNPRSGTADAAGPVERWAEARGHRLVRTETPEQAEQLAREAADDGRTVVAAGGDGTVHVVAAGLLASDASRPRLGVVPLGTGNDLARSLALPEDPEGVLQVLDLGHVQPLDVLAVTHDDRERWCVNVASAGFSGELAREMTDELKARLGPMAYVWGGLTVGAEVQPFAVELEIDGELIREERALNVVVANGRFAAGGFDLAPEARLDDGLAEVIIVPYDDGWLAQAGLGARLLAGDYTQAPGVRTLRGREVSLRSDPDMELNLDGEPIGSGSLRLRVEPGALEVLRPPPVEGLPTR